MKRILIAGCGDIALRVAPLLRSRCQIFGLVRDSRRHTKLRIAGIIPLSGDLDDRASLTRITGLADTVLHFAPPSNTPLPGTSQNSSITDIRTRNLLSALSRGVPPKRLIYISTSGVYGDCAGAKVNEAHPLNLQTLRAQLRVNAENQIREWARRNHVNASILRVPGIYAADRLPLERLCSGTPMINSEEDSYTNHIHADDLARIVVAAIRHTRACRSYNACDDGELKMGDYFDLVADAHGIQRPPRLPRAEVESKVSPALWSFINESRRLTNLRMKRELKVRLRYPTVALALIKTV
jgi:nucleoside-diphosphate-sugar epimerase